MASRNFRIIPYQEINGNYNLPVFLSTLCNIIPYQEINGNYNITPEQMEDILIIPYQEINGNYNPNVSVNVFG